MGRLAGLFHPGGFVRVGDDLMWVRPLKLRDVAELNVWLESVKPHPFESIRGEVDQHEIGSEEHDLLLAQCLEESEGWGPSILGLEYARLFTVEGKAQFLMTVVRDLNRHEALDLASRVDRDQFAAIRRLAFGYDPQRELETLFLASEPKSPRPPSIDNDDGFAGMLKQLATDYGWTPAEVGEMTLPQLRAFFPEEASISDATREDRIARQERALGRRFTNE